MLEVQILESSAGSECRQKREAVLGISFTLLRKNFREMKRNQQRKM